MFVARCEVYAYLFFAFVEVIVFVIADRIAQNVPGFSYDSASRLSAGILYALNLARMEYGHTYVPRASLIGYAVKLLGVDEEAVSDTLDALIGKGELVYQMVGDDDGILLPWVQRMEQSVAEKLIQLTEKPIANPFLNLALTQNHSIQLAPQQYEAVEAALNEGLLVITGGPGTGKTTIIRCITEILSDMQMDFALAAPTGRAAKRMTEATGCEAKTIHRLLEYIPGEGFTRNDENPLIYDIVIIDEASMVDIPLMSALLKAIVPGTRLILVGDSDQLPSVGAGNVLKDIIESDSISCIKLTEIFRQARESMIVVNAHRINHGEMPMFNDADNDFFLVTRDDPLTIPDTIADLCARRLPRFYGFNGISQIQVLTPTRKSLIGVANLNAILQDKLNPPSPDREEYSTARCTYRLGDKVMQIKNNYQMEWERLDGTEKGLGIFNGDVGFISDINKNSKKMTVIFDDRAVIYDFMLLDELELAYAATVHKSQGSEFDAVIMPMCETHRLLMTRNLLYTAITRAKKLVVLVGNEDVIKQYVDNDNIQRRFSGLKYKMRIF